MVTNKQFNTLYNKFSKHLTYVTNKHKVNRDEYLKVIIEYINVNSSILDNRISPVEEIDDNVNFD